MNYHVQIRFTHKPKISDGAGGFTEGAEVELYKTVGEVKHLQSTRSENTQSSEINTRIAFEFYKPPNLTVDTSSILYVDGELYAVVSVSKTNFTPIKYIISAIKRDG